MESSSFVPGFHADDDVSIISLFWWNAINDVIPDGS
jgi:hypothetical protein